MIWQVSKRRLRLELAGVVLVTVAGYFLADSLDVFERIYRFTREHESWELDEWIPAAIVLAAALAVYSVRRWIDTRRQANELAEALAEIKVLRGIVPICSSCKAIRDEEGTWQPLESYLDRHTEAALSHGVCPRCQVELYGDLYDENDGR